MEAAAASTEIQVLGWSALLLIAQVTLQASILGNLTPAYLFSSRDEELKNTSVMAGRLNRALRNLLETYPAFIALAVALAFTGDTGGIAAIGAIIWIICRVVYVVLYAAGIPVLRTLVWFGSIIGLALMFIRFLF